VKVFTIEKFLPHGLEDIWEMKTNLLPFMTNSKGASLKESNSLLIQPLLKDSGIGGLMNSLKKADEALYDKILPEYKKDGSGL